MPSSTATGATTRVFRPFVITTYAPDPSGVLVPVLPVQCIACPPASRGACLLRVDHRRPRKTGPGFALTVMSCATHDLAFTLYPPGHVPHGRVAIAPISSTTGAGTPSELLFAADNSPRERERSSIVATAIPSDPCVPAADSALPARRALDWDVTVFEAARDAVDRRAWSRAREGTPPKRWRTQGRKIALGAAMLGLLSAPEPRLGIAEALGIAPLALSDVARSFVAATGFRARGQAVCDTLDLLTVSRSLGDRLLVAGAKSGCWGEPLRCDPHSGRLLALSNAARAPP